MSRRVGVGGSLGGSFALFPLFGGSFCVLVGVSAQEAPHSETLENF